MKKLLFCLMVFGAVKLYAAGTITECRATPYFDKNSPNAAHSFTCAPVIGPITAYYVGAVCYNNTATGTIYLEGRQSDGTVKARFAVGLPGVWPVPSDRELFWGQAFFNGLVFSIPDGGSCTLYTSEQQPIL